MKKLTKKLIVVPAVILVSLVVFLVIMNVIVLPLYVSGQEFSVPNLIGKNKDTAIKILKDMDLNPIINSSRYDEKYPKDQIIFQKPLPKSIVKEGRRIYLTVSGGDQLIRMPNLINKTLRDAKITLIRTGLELGKIDSIESEFPVDIVCDQEFFEGREVPKGTEVNITLSLGPRIGMIRIPNILGHTLNEAEKILKTNSLRIGMKTYITSTTLLPNTVTDQQPSEGTLVPVGDSVNVVLTQSKK